MKQEDIELYAFLFFCGEEDRDLLLGRKTATYKDFSRFLYLADFLGFDNFFQKLGDMFGEYFYENAKRKEHVYLDGWKGEEGNEEIDEAIGNAMAEQEQWLADFCGNARNWKKKLLRKIVGDICEEKGLLIESVNEDAVP